MKSEKSQKLVKATSTICAMCKYRSGDRERHSCSYWGITGQSRIFKDGKMAYDPQYCDKFERGKRLDSRLDWANDMNRLIPHEENPLGYCPWQE